MRYACWTAYGWMVSLEAPPHLWMLPEGRVHVLLAVSAPTACIWCRAAAQSLIRGTDGDVSLGWDMPAHRSAAVLCFDEMQVTDPFAAVALKGLPHH